MAKPIQEAIETFMSITGVPEAVAVQKLEEHGGDLNEAVNSHFSEGDRNTVNTASFTAPEDDVMDIDDPDLNESWARPPLPLLAAEVPLGDSLARRFFDHSSGLGNRPPVVTHPRQVREIPIEVKDGNGPSASVGRGPTIEDITGSEDNHGPTVRGTVTFDEEDDDNEDIPAVSSAQQSEKKVYDASGVSSQDSHARPTAPEFNSLADYNDVEEEMIRAAIEASKKDIARIDNELYNSDSQHEQSPFKDAEPAHAVSASPEEAEREKRLQDRKFDNQVLEDVPVNPSEVEVGKELSSNGRSEVGTSSVQDEVEEAEQPLIRRRSRRTSSRSVQPVLENDDIPPSGVNDLTHDPGHYDNSIHSDEWGGISSLEHDEAVMLEAAMFGGIPEGSGYHFPYAPHQLMHGGSLYPRQAPRPPSPSLEAQRLIREQQDDEYLASLQADQEKELRAKAEAEARQLEEEAARQAALEEERRKEEECRRKMEEQQELERQLAAKEASLPEEPAADDDNAVTLVVKMPDGSRRGRRFLKADKLQSLFDFIDIGRGVKPGTYRLVRPYPRRAFSNGESGLALNQLGLTSKQEALFLELI